MEALITRCEESLRLGAVDNAVFLADKLFRLHTSEQTALLYVEALSRYREGVNIMSIGHLVHSRFLSTTLFLCDYHLQLLPTGKASSTKPDRSHHRG